MGEQVAIDGARDRMVAWLLDAEAAKAAKAELRRFGLDFYDASDLINDVVVSVLQADFDVAADNPVAYVRRALTNRARDLLRADGVRGRRLADVRVTEDGTGEQHDPLAQMADPAALDPSMLTAARAAENELHRHLQLALARTKVWIVAAALTTITLRLHDDVAVPDGAPQPEVGHRDKGDRWAALWLAGEVAAFPDAAGGEPETAAMRKARSRKLQDVDALLLSAFESLRAEGGIDA